MKIPEMSIYGIWAVTSAKEYGIEHSKGDYIMKSTKMRIFFKIMLICAVICSSLYLSACSGKKVTDDQKPSATPAAATATPTPEADDTEIGDDDENLEGGEEGTDNFDGYVGTVEIEEAGGAELPLLVYDGLSYCLYDDHAEVIFTWFSDDSYEDYVIRSSVEYEGKTYPVTAIGSDALNSFAFAVSVTIPDTVTSIGSSAFEFCEALESITIPASVTEIGGYAFSECAALKEIVIPDSVTKIGSGIFYNCSALTSVTLPSGLSEIPEETFSGCEQLTTVELPAGIASIGREAFWYCEALESIELPEGLAVIEESAFYDCSALKEIRIPKSLLSLSESALDACDSLATIYCPASLKSKFGEIFDGYDVEVVEY
jgi:hypothetical protein